MRVAVITDSTASLPPELARQWGIRVVPLRIRIGDHLDDEIRVPAATVVAAMRADRPVSTEPPEPAALYWAYRAAAEDGADAVVSVHISSRQSKTAEHAREAAARVGLPVNVVDSRTMGMSLGYAVTAAARVAGAGGSPGRIIDALQRRLDGGSTFIYVETLDHLRRGGRIGAAAHLVGTALSVKPLLTMRDGQIAPLDRVIGGGRAKRRLADIATAAAGDRTVDVAVEHVGAPGQAAELMAELTERIPGVRERVVTDASSAIAVHAGPGMLSVVVSQT
ncbi:DegV family protein [Actinokineospora spheciospongiae]|uniref:DegV family protein n=1 Tax=Actinokineospora spheciospongiae TaxID=909613 RepID=UPI000D712C2E|nr:DegV family protein [Actinokineospora spheciospongiae]PWW55435.1 DegV family protein with EDD domain [Actinokineospora spheciospongiae]